MKKILFISALFVSAGAAFGQVDSTSESTTPDTTKSTTTSTTTSTTITTPQGDASISDEDLKKYAVTMDSVNGMKQSLLSEITKKVQGNTAITVSRYNELYKVIGDEVKLAEAKATPEEIAFVKEVDAFKNEGAAKINEQFQKLAKEYVGVATFNKIKNSLATDNDLKSRYDQILGQVEGAGTASTK